MAGRISGEGVTTGRLAALASAGYDLIGLPYRVAVAARTAIYEAGWRAATGASPGSS